MNADEAQTSTALPGNLTAPESDPAEATIPRGLEPLLTEQILVVGRISDHLRPAWFTAPGFVTGFGAHFAIGPYAADLSDATSRQSVPFYYAVTPELLFRVNYSCFFTSYQRMPFICQLNTPTGEPVIRLRFPYETSSNQPMDVLGADGQLLGSLLVDNEWNHLAYRILDAKQETVLRLRGPFCSKSTCCFDFDLLTLDGVVIGSIGAGDTSRPYTVKFVASFPLDLDVSLKATLLATTLMLLSKSTIRRMMQNDELSRLAN